MRRHEGLVQAYLQHIAREARERHDKLGGTLETIYFGGGTPSHLKDAELTHLITTLQDTWGFPAAETTLEADPLTFDQDRLQFFHDLGINRLSIGLQSCQDGVLKFLGRTHSANEGLQAVEMALEAGFRVSADLITAVPMQDAAYDLHTLAQTGVGHISVYNLTIEPYTPFALRGVTVDEDKEADDYALANEVLSGYGFDRYEVSSHAKPTQASQHNQMYWRGAYFIALGPGAAGFVPSNTGIGVRYTNPPIKGWLEQQPPETLDVTPKIFAEDMLMTGLRTKRGVNLEHVYTKSGIDVLEHYAAILERFFKQNLLTVDQPYLRATKTGLLHLNGMLAAFFASEQR
jgi:oxygen-independent coproporphyrinogen-3 oxidase